MKDLFSAQDGCGCVPKTALVRQTLGWVWRCELYHGYHYRVLIPPSLHSPTKTGGGALSLTYPINSTTWSFLSKQSHKAQSYILWWNAYKASWYHAGRPLPNHASLARSKQMTQREGLEITYPRNSYFQAFQYNFSKNVLSVYCYWVYNICPALLDQFCPVEFSVVVWMFYIHNVQYGSHQVMWLLSIWNVTPVTKNLSFYLFNINWF